jgi:hypothetical protein
LLTISDGTLERYDKILAAASNSDAGSSLDRTFEVVVTCKDDRAATCFEDLKAQGYDVRILTL